MQCSVTKDKLRKMLTTNPQGIASFFKTINEQDFYTPLNKQRSAAEQLEHLRLAYKTGTDLVKDSEALNQNAKGSYRMYSVIAKLFQASLNHSKRQIKKPDAS